jgi:hypothetical protein
MDTTGPDGAQLLAPLRDVEPVAPSTVDVRRAVLVGARRRRTRQAVSAAAVAAVVALVLAVVPAIADWRHDSAPPANQLTEFDVLRQRLTVGSAGGYTPVSIQTGRHEQRVLLRIAAEPAAAPSANVVLYAAGRAPELDLGDPAPDVYGHRSYWLTGVPDTQLAWEWAPDAWVVIQADAVGEQARVVVHRVALSVRTTGNLRQRLPFTVADGRRLAGVITPYGATSPSAGAFVVLDDTAGQVFVGVLAGPDVLTDVLSAPGTPNTQLDGRSAAVGASTVRIYDVGFGWDVVAEAVGAQPMPGLTALAQSVTVVAGADPRSWTADPLR